jgi:hypothetical protein
MRKRTPAKESFSQVRLGFRLSLFRAHTPDFSTECGPGVDQIHLDFMELEPIWCSSFLGGMRITAVRVKCSFR